VFLWNPRRFRIVAVGLSAWGVANAVHAEPATVVSSQPPVSEPATASSTATPLAPSATLTTAPTASVVIEPEKAEVDRLPPPRARALTVGIGLGSTALWYAGALGIGELWSRAPGREHLKLPIVGPYLDLAETGCPASESDCSLTELVLRTVLVSLDALGQTGSLAIAIQGLVMSTSTTESSAPPAPASTSERASVRIVPQLASDTGTGVAVLGTF